MESWLFKPWPLHSIKEKQKPYSFVGGPETVMFYWVQFYLFVLSIFLPVFHTKPKPVLDYHWALKSLLAP